MSRLGHDRPTRRWAPELTIAVGVLVMVVAGAPAGHYTPSWLDPGDSCAVERFCGDPSPVLHRLWLVEGIGFAIAALGLGTIRRRPTDPTRGPARPALHVAAAGALGAALFVVLGPLLLLAVLISPQVGAATLCVLWLLQIRVLDGVDRAFGPPAGERGIGAAAPATGFLALAAMGVAYEAVLRPDGFRMSGFWLLVLVHGGCLVLGALLTRRNPRVGVAVLGAIGLVLATGVAVAESGLLHRPAAPPPRAAPAPPPTTPLPTTPPLVVADPVTTAAAAPTTPAPTVAASIPCTGPGLAWSTVGWDATMGARAVTVVARNTGSRPCYVDGFAAVRIDRGTRPLQLTTRDGDPDDPYVGATAQRVGVAPGGTAWFPLAWRMHAAGTDPTTPQSLQVALAGTGTWSDVVLGEGPAPFDLADGATVTLGGWRPGPP